MIRAVVCGGRYYGEVPPGTSLDDEPSALRRAQAQREHFGRTMDSLHADRRVIYVADGKCRSGADWLGYQWRGWLKLPGRRYQADWARHGRSAGPRRNGEMLEAELLNAAADGHPLVVIAFPGGAGTADMVRRARVAGVEVIEVEDIA